MDDDKSALRNLAELFLRLIIGGILFAGPIFYFLRHYANPPKDKAVESSPVTLPAESVDTPAELEEKSEEKN